MAARFVPFHDGSRYTFGVERYAVGFRPGWRVVRIDKACWCLPTGIFDYFTPEALTRFVSLGSPTQRTAWEKNIRCRYLGKTRNATVRGVYHVGSRWLHVEPTHPRCAVTPFNGEYHGQVYTGIHFAFPDNPDLNYFLATPKDVTLATFYKYLLFYPAYVVAEYEHKAFPLPYGRDRRLAGCSIENFSNTPTLSEKRPSMLTTTSEMSLAL